MNNANVIKSTNPRTRRIRHHQPVKTLTINELIAYCYDLEGCIEPVTLISYIISLQRKIAETEKRCQELQELNSQIANTQDVNESAMIGIQKNENAIKKFFAMHGAKTGKRLSAFLFEMMALYAASPENYELWHREEAAMHFGMLHDLVGGLREVG